MFRNFIIYLFVFLSFFFVTANLLYSQSQIEYGPIYGGTGGNYFSDKPNINSRIYQIRIRAGLYIDSIQVFYDTPAGPQPNEQRGGNGGAEFIFNLNPSEYIKKISIRYGRFIDRLQIHTNFREPIYGGPGGSTFIEIKPPGDGYHIIGFHGRSGALLDAIGIISARR